MATSPSEGWVEFVHGALPLSVILDTTPSPAPASASASAGDGAGGEADVEGGRGGMQCDANPLLLFLRAHAPLSPVPAPASSSPSPPFSVPEHVLQRYAISAARSTVLSFILGVGDRHLDNVLLTPRGDLLHVDFGYIFGQDPRPSMLFRPMVRVSPAMLAALGPADGPLYLTFLHEVREAYVALRRRASFLLSLPRCLDREGCPITDLNVKQDCATALLGVADRLQLDRDDDDARAYIQETVLTASNAFMPEVLEAVHKLAQRGRSLF